MHERVLHIEDHCISALIGLTEFILLNILGNDCSNSKLQPHDGFQNGDTRPLVIGDGDQPVLVVLAIADLADFRAHVAELLGNPVDAGWLRYYLRSNFDMSSETLVEQLGVDTDHGLSSLASQVNVEQAAVLLPDHLRRAEAGANPLMLLDGL